jgi:hypothetical protein
VIEKPVRTTAKQAELIVALLRGIGLTDDDLAGSVSQFRNKASNKVSDLPFPDDDKALVEWLRRGGKPVRVIIIPGSFDNSVTR